MYDLCMWCMGDFMLVDVYLEIDGMFIVIEGYVIVIDVWCWVLEVYFVLDVMMYVDLVDVVDVLE